jgi:hypothetical protein
MLPDNPLRGEASVDISGATYQLTFDVSAFIFAQQATGKKMMEMVTAFSEDPDDLITLRAMIWAGLQRKHPMPIGEVDELISSAGLAKARSVVSDGLAAAFGGAEEARETGKAPKPQAKRGTG